MIRTSVPALNRRRSTIELRTQVAAVGIEPTSFVLVDDVLLSPGFSAELYGQVEGKGFEPLSPPLLVESCSIRPSLVEAWAWFSHNEP